MLTTAINLLVQRKDLNSTTCRQAMLALSDANPVQIAAFLALLRAKQETVTELVTMVNVLREQMLAVKVDSATLDIVGTGGDGANTVNISTGSAILAASCGVKIAKHGNRAVSSQSGSADVLTALGIALSTTSEQVAHSIETVGIGFCFAPYFHPLMQKLLPVRRQLAIPTTFNLLGPLLNPVRPSYFILGVMNAALINPLAQVLQQMMITRALVVHSHGLDELSCLGIAQVLEVTPTTITPFVLDPKDFGLTDCQLADLQGGDAKMNAQLLLDVFNGNPNPLADTLIFNAGVALWLYGKYDTIHAAIDCAKAHLANGQTLAFLNHWRAFSHAQ